MRGHPTERAQLGYGLIGTLAVLLVLGLALAAYQGRFTSGFDITVEADRAGLGLTPGATVNYRGVAVGRVQAIEPDPDGGVRLSVRMFRSAARDVPANVSSTIDSSTLFGPKTVQLVAETESSPSPIGEGAVVETSAVSPEINSLYEQTYGLLTAIDIKQLNRALSGMAATLDGRGAEIGRAGSQVLNYVEVVNKHLPALENDVRLGGRLATDYRAAVPDLLGTADNVAEISETLVELRPTLDTFLLSLSRSVGEADLMVQESGDLFTTTLARLRPTLDVLGEFSPMVGCTIKGMNEDRKLARSVIGNKVPAIQASFEFLPAQRPYRPEDSLPKHVTGIGPRCYGLPLRKADGPAPHYLFDDGTIAAWTAGDGDSLSLSLDSLFGANLNELLGLDASGSGKGGR